MNEQAVIQSVQQGNTEAFRVLFEENRQKIFYLAYQYTKNVEDAEDILQETFIKAYHSLHKFNVQNNTNFSSWLYRIGINCSIDLLRRNKKKRETISGIDNLENISSNNKDMDPEHTRRTEEIREKVTYVLNKLTAKQRMIFILKHYQQLSINEIAEYLSCSEGSVKKQLFRAVSAVKKPLKKLLLENYYEMQKI